MKSTFGRLFILSVFVIQTVNPVIVCDGAEQTITAGKDSVSIVSRNTEINEQCLTCHGRVGPDYRNDTVFSGTKPEILEKMIINRAGFLKSNHRSFRCTDCHSGDFARFPHAEELKKEVMPSCLECHGYDEKYTGFHFEDIETEFKVSVHCKTDKESFTCWTCHNPHYDKLYNPDSLGIRQIVHNDNLICTDCHENKRHFSRFSDSSVVNISKAHRFLPRRRAHLNNIRCIDCHASADTKVPVPHMVLSKEKAVKDCNECHSRNSLMAEKMFRSEPGGKLQKGFYNGKMTGYVYLAGANRNGYLNMVSLIVFSLMLIAVMVHIIIRVVISKK